MTPDTTDAAPSDEPEEDNDPTPYTTPWSDIGSRTVGGYECFIVEFDAYNDKFTIQHEVETSTGDIFWEIGYWPERILWESSAPTLRETLAGLVEMRRLDATELIDNIAEHAPSDDFSAQIGREENPLSHPVSASTTPLSEPEEARLFLYCPFEGKERDGLEIIWTGTTWTARLYCDETNHDCYFDEPEVWSGDTLEAAYEQAEGRIPLSLEELSADLIAEDSSLAAVLRPKRHEAVPLHADSPADPFHWTEFAFSLIVSSESGEKEIDVYFSRDGSDWTLSAPSVPGLTASYHLQGYGGKVMMYLAPSFLKVCKAVLPALKFGRSGKVSLEQLAGYGLSDAKTNR